MRIGVAATPQVAIPTLDWLLQTDHELSLVITRPDKPSGRGRLISSSIVGEWASKHAIPTVKPSDSAQLRGVIDNLDLVITIGYGVILPEDILSLPKHGFLNLHFSLLPQYRGAAPVQRALLDGQELTGVTVFHLDKGMDTGPIFSQIEVGIDPSWRTVELLEHLAELGPQAIGQALSALEKGVVPLVQTGAPTFAPKITKQEAFLDFSLDSTRVLNAIRAFTYEPGAWTLWRGEPFKITGSKRVDPLNLAPGEILLDSKRLFVGCGKDSCLEILTVIPSGKKEMSGIDWARGARLEIEDHFG